MRTFDTIICDVDGVLIDVSGSFTAAAIDAVKSATQSDLFTSAEVRQLKGARGFNNDWHVAVAGAAWARYVPAWPFARFVTAIEESGGGLDGVAALLDVALTSDFIDTVTRLAQEAYGGLEACERLYDFEPETIRQAGRFLDEQPLPGAVEIRARVKRLGIVSGRNKNEMALASDTLGWSLPEGLMALFDDPELNKPNPKNLLAICALLESNQTLYAGDSRDDYELVKNATREFPEKIVFAGIGPRRPPWNTGGLQFKSMEHLLSEIEVYND